MASENWKDEVAGSRVSQIAKEIEDSDIVPKTKQQFLDEIDDFCPVLEEDDLYNAIGVSQYHPTSSTTNEPLSQPQAAAMPAFSPQSLGSGWSNQATVSRTYDVPQAPVQLDTMTANTPQHGSYPVHPQNLGTYDPMLGYRPGIGFPAYLIPQYQVAPYTMLDPQAVPYDPHHATQPAFQPPAVPVLPTLPSRPTNEAQQYQYELHYECHVPSCNSFFATDALRTTHCQENHWGSLRSLEVSFGKKACFRCGKTFKSSQGFVAHDRAEH